MRKRWWKKTSDWLVIWASGLLTFIVIYRPNAPALTSVASILGAVVLAHVGGNKAVDFKHGVDLEGGTLYHGSEVKNDPKSKE
jgi:hypothetical protein